MFSSMWLRYAPDRTAENGRRRVVLVPPCNKSVQFSLGFCSLRMRCVPCGAEITLCTSRYLFPSTDRDIPYV